MSFVSLPDSAPPSAVAPLVGARGRRSARAAALPRLEPVARMELTRLEREEPSRPINARSTATSGDGPDSCWH